MKHVNNMYFMMSALKIITKNGFPMPLQDGTGVTTIHHDACITGVLVLFIKHAKLPSNKFHDQICILGAVSLYIHSFHSGVPNL